MDSIVDVMDRTVWRGEGTQSPEEDLLDACKILLDMVPPAERSYWEERGVMRWVADVMLRAEYRIEAKRIREKKEGKSE